MPRSRRGPAPARRRRGQPHHRRRRRRSRPRPTAKLCQRKIVWRNGMSPPGTRPPCATMSRIGRLQRAGRRHLQRRRSAEPLRPDAAEAEQARRRQRAVVDAFDAPRDLDRQHRAEDQAEAPVEPRRSPARRRRPAPPRRAASRGHAGDRADQPAHRRRGGEHVAGDDDQRHLQRERDQVPEAAAPGVDRLRSASRASRPARRRSTRTVAISAKMNASGTQRSVQSVSASAARATAPGCSVILSGG